MGQWRRLQSGFVVACLAMFAVTPVALAEDGGQGPGGPSTPSAVVVANNAPRAPDTLQLAVAAHTSRDAVPSASLVLRIDGLAVTGFDVHRVAVGDTSCGGHEDAAAVEEDHDGVRALVRGVGVLTTGDERLPEGSAVQVWIDLKDRGRQPYVDQGRVRIRPAPHAGEVTVAAHDDGCSGGSGGWTVDTGWRDVLQVQTHQRRG